MNCGSGKTLAKALERGNEDRPLLVLVQGVCNETVVIERSDVTLRGEPGAAINGPDAGARHPDGRAPTASSIERPGRQRRQERHPGHGGAGNGHDPRHHGPV